MASFQWPGTTTSAVPTYSTLSAFPSASGAGNGAFAAALDTNVLYESNGSSWLPVANPTAVFGIGTIDTTSNTNGASIVSNLLIMQSASATKPGLVNTTTQTLAGQKTFSTGVTMGGNIAMGGNEITGLPVPAMNGEPLVLDQLGAVNGVAPLGASGKIAVGYLPADVFVYQGTWDASTNTPTLQDSTGVTAGYVYWVSAAAAGPISGLNNASMVNFQVGDLVLYNGTQYELTTPAAGVQSVNGAQGAVTVNAINQLTGDVTASAASGSQSKATSLVATTNSTLATLSGLTTAGSLVTVGTITTGTWAGTTVAIAHGGTGVTSVTTVPTASSFAGWDANSNLFANSIGVGYATTVSSASLITLTAASAWHQRITGSSPQTVQLPVATTMAVGQSFFFSVASSGTLTINNPDTTLFTTEAGSGSQYLVTCTNNGSSNGSWVAVNLFLGTTTVGHGGTGISSGTSGGILGYTATGTLASSALLTANGVVIGGGAGATPTSTAAGITGQVLTGSTGNPPVWSTAGTGTVTSVAASVPSVLSISGSPITSSGTLTIGYSGTALPVANGGTGVTTSTGTGNTVLSIAPTITGAAQITGTSCQIGGATTSFGEGTGQHTINGGGATANALQITMQSSSDSAFRGLVIQKADNVSTTAQKFILFQINAGGANCGGIAANGASTAAFEVVSDARLKKNIKPLAGSLALVTALNPVNFDYTDDTGNNNGFVAQEMATVFPNDVSTDKDGMLSIVGWSPQMAHLVAAIKELQARIESLEAKLH